MKILSAAFAAALCVHAWSQETGSEQISLSDIWSSGKFYSESVNGGRSMNDGVHYSQLIRADSGQYLITYAYQTGLPTDTLLRPGDFTGPGGKPIFFSSYEFNPEETKLLLATDEEPIYRYSSKANYYIYDVRSKQYMPLTDFAYGKQQLPAFSPAAPVVAYVRDNDLFLKNTSTGAERAITTDGQVTRVINGAVDWVYEEEFGFDRGFQWSPDGAYIAYYRFDESAVRMYSLTYYDSLYPTPYVYKYPKAGETNSTVSIQLYDVSRGTTHTLNTGEEKDNYLPRIKWHDSKNMLLVQRMNRLQNTLELLKFTAGINSSDLAPEVIYEEKSTSYIDISDNLTFLPDGKHFLFSSEKDGYNHLYIQNLEGGTGLQLTKGEWVVVDLYGINAEKGQVYFSAAISSPLTRGIYSISYTEALKKLETSKKSLVQAAGDYRSKLRTLTENDHTNSARFSSNCRYFINSTSSANSPPQISLHRNDGKRLRTLVTNQELRSRMDKLNLGEKKFGSFPTVDGTALNYSVIYPPQFDSTEVYPALFLIYGGPGHNTVSDSWDGVGYFWQQMLAQQGYIVISVDPRGTMYRGRAFKHSTYGDLGNLETLDMQAASNYFGSWRNIDEKRMGIMGWSYGGYLSSLAMMRTPDAFAAGVAVAPVTNWRFYDTIYTERFLGKPQDNPEGYDRNSPLTYADQLKGHYLLIHGDADDNVHVQNSMEMVEALVAANKEFDFFIYPNKNHGIYGGNTRYHLYKMIFDFFEAHLQP